MKTEFPLHEIMNIHFLNELMNMFYHNTSNKLRVSFNGSKGYLSHIEFECEGLQSNLDSRRIFLRKSETLNKDGSIKKKIFVKMTHTRDKGLKIELGL